MIPGVIERGRREGAEARRDTEDGENEEASKGLKKT